MPLSVAVCVAGQQRTLLAMPVAATFSAHVIEAHRSIGHTVDTFMVILGRSRDRSEAQRRRLRAAVSAAYSPTRLALSEERELDQMPLHCRPIANSRYVNRLTQYIGIREAYQQMEQHERERGARYEWVYRTRPDMVYLAPSPFAQAGLLERPEAGEAAFVLAGTDDARASHTCLNDMIFACPRALCRPHFHLLELWESPHCNATSCGRGCGMQGGAVPPPLPRGLDGPPTSPFALPTAPRNMGEWYSAARYHDGRICPDDPRARPRLCCGRRLREVLWPVTLARPAGRTRHSSRRNIECAWRLTANARFEHRPLLRPFVAPCRALRAAWLADGGEDADDGAGRTREQDAARLRGLLASSSNATSQAFRCASVDLHTTCSRLGAWSERSWLRAASAPSDREIERSSGWLA